MGGAPAHLDPGVVQLPGHLPIGHAVLFAAEGVLVGVQKQAHLHAALAGGGQRFDQRPVRQIEHAHIQTLAGVRVIDCLQQGVADRRFAEHRHGGAVLLLVRGPGASQGPAVQAVRSGERRRRPFRLQQIERRRATETHRDVGVGAAGVVGIGGGDQAGPGVAFVHHQGFTVVGLEVDQRQVGAQGDLAVAGGVGQPAAFGAVAGPLAAQPPQRRPARVGIAQARQIREHHPHPGRFQALQMGRADAAVERVEAVGDQHRAQVRALLFALDQSVGELFAERAQGVGGGAGHVVEQEHVHHHQLLRLVDQAEELVEDRLIEMAPGFTLAIRRRLIHPGVVDQYRHILRRPRRPSLAHALGQRFEHMVKGGEQPGASQHQNQQKNGAFAGRRHGLSVLLWLRGLFEYTENTFLASRRQAALAFRGRGPLPQGGHRHCASGPCGRFYVVPQAGLAFA